MPNKNIYAMTPINRTAAMVTSQSGCGGEPYSETKKEKQVRLKNQFDWVLSLREKYPKKSRQYKKLTAELREIHEELTKNKRLMKNVNPKDRDLDNYIIDVLRRKFSKDEWLEIVEQARKRKRTNDKAVWVEKE